MFNASFNYQNNRDDEERLNDSHSSVNLFIKSKFNEHEYRAQNIVEKCKQQKYKTQSNFSDVGFKSSTVKTTSDIEIASNSPNNRQGLFLTDNGKCTKAMSGQGNRISRCKDTKKHFWNGKRHKQIEHCNVERRRRNLINERIAKLQQLLFPGSTKCKRSDILKKAIDCITRMNKDCKRISEIESANVKLIQDNKILTSQVQMLKSLIKTKAYVPSNETEHNQYHTKTSNASFERTVKEHDNYANAQMMQPAVESTSPTATQIDGYFDDYLFV